jgi:hypothetical protein
MKRFLAMMALGAALAGCSIVPNSAPTAQRASPYRWTHGHAPKAQAALVARFGKASLKPGEYLWAPKLPPAGDTRIVVDLRRQTAYVYRGEALVGASAISSGKRGNETPLGYWPVLEKRKFARSRKYDNAPMPFFQRLDEYGIALHGGANPGYPASHGCVRFPLKFAERLFGLTKIGTQVVIEG